MVAIYYNVGGICIPSVCYKCKVIYTKYKPVCKICRANLKYVDWPTANLITTIKDEYKIYDNGRKLLLLQQHIYTFVQEESVLNKYFTICIELQE